MEGEERHQYLQKIIDGIDLGENLKIRALESEIGTHQIVMDKIISQEWTVSEEQKDINIQIRKLQLQESRHKWDDNVKVTQAKHDKWGKKEYEEKLANIQHNYQHLVSILDSEDYLPHFDLIQKVNGFEDKIETLLAIYEKRKEREEYVKSLPKPKSYLNKITQRNKKIDKKRYKTNEQIAEEKKLKKLEIAKQERLKNIEESKEKKEEERKSKV